MRGGQIQASQASNRKCLRMSAKIHVCFYLKCFNLSFNLWLNWHFPKLNPKLYFRWKTNMKLPRQQRHKHDPWPQEAIHPANVSPGAEQSMGAMGTAVRNRGCAAGCHGNAAASSAGCQRVSVHQLFLFLEIQFHQPFSIASTHSADVRR